MTRMTTCTREALERDKSGNITNFSSYNSNGDLEHYDVREYTEDGKFKAGYHYTSDGRLISSRDCLHDSSGNCVEWRNYSPKGVLLRKTVNEYDSNGNIIKSFSYNSSGEILSSDVREYDGEDRFTVGYYYNSLGNLIGSTEFGYDSDGNHVNTAHYDPSGDKVAETKNGYDSLGRKTSTHEYNSDGVLVQSDERKYFANFDILTEIDTYYTTSYSTRLESRTLQKPDKDGHIYYHWKNEDYRDMGVQRLDYKVFASPQDESVMGYRMEYYEGSGRYEHAYASADISDPSNPVLENLVFSLFYRWDGKIIKKYPDNSSYEYDSSWRLLTQTDPDGTRYAYTYPEGKIVKECSNGYIFEYDTSWNILKQTTPDGTIYKYYPSGELRSKTIQTSPLTFITYTYYSNGLLESKTLVNLGFIWYYHYIDEDFNDQSYGRVDSQVSELPDPDGALAYSFEYHAGSNEYSKKTCYSTVDCSDPSDPALSNVVAVYEYYEDGTVSKKTEYHNNAPSIEYTFFPSGNMQAKVVHLGPSTSKTYTYYDESFFSNVGRLREYNYTSLDLSTVVRRVYLEYWGSAGMVKTMNEYRPWGNTYYTYYSNGDLESKIATGAHPEVYYHYVDFVHRRHPDATSRIDIEVHNNPRNDGLAYSFEYYEYNGMLRKKTGYHTADYSDPSNPVLSAIAVVYEYDTTYMLIKKTEYQYLNDFNQNMPVRECTYYPSGNLRTMRDSTHPSGYLNYPAWITYTWLDENFDGNGVGRLYEEEYNDASHHSITRKTYLEYWGDSSIAKRVQEYQAGNNTYYTYYSNGDLESKIESGAHPERYYHYAIGGGLDIEIHNCPRPDGIAYSFEWYEDSGLYSKKTGYAAADYSDPSNPVLSDIIVVYEYDTNGSLVKKTEYQYLDVFGKNMPTTECTYYPSGNLRTMRYSTALSGHLIDPPWMVYTWLDENFDGNGVGRLYKEESGYPTPHRLETKTYLEYWGNTNIVKTMSEKKPHVPPTYYTYYSTGKLESKTNWLTAGPGPVSSYYHYINDTWIVGRSYGRIDVQGLPAPDGYGASAYVYEYFPETETVSFKVFFKSLDTSDPSLPYFSGRIMVIGYDENGEEKLAYTFYDAQGGYSGCRKAKWLAEPDENGFIYYRYMPDGSGRVEMAILDYRLETVMGGNLMAYTEGYTYEYHENSSVVKTKYCFVNAHLPISLDTKKINYLTDPTLFNLNAKYEYDASGSQAAYYSYYHPGDKLRSVTFTSPDEHGNLFYRYLAGGLPNRPDQIVRSAPSSNGALGYYLEYYEETDILKKRLCYKNANHSNPVNAGLDH